MDGNGRPSSPAKAAREFASAPAQSFDLAKTPVKGPADAPVKVVEFSDFLCPYCGALEEETRDDLARLGVHAPPIDLSSTYPVPDLAEGTASLDAFAAGAATAPNGRFLRFTVPSARIIDIRVTCNVGDASCVGLPQPDPDLDRRRLVALRVERLQHRAGRGERDLVLARAAAGDDCDAQPPPHGAAAGPASGPPAPQQPAPPGRSRLR